MLTIDQKLAKNKEGFLKLSQKIKALKNAVALLHWDMVTGMPAKGVSQRSEIISFLSTEAFKLSISAEMKEYLDYLSEPEVNQNLDPILKGAVRECRKLYEKYKKIPAARYRDYVQLSSEAESIWEKAKNSNDFELFQPYLEKIISFQKEFLESWGYEGNKYNTLLDFYEPGITVEKLDEIFEQLRTKIVPLLNKIKAATYQVDDSFLKKYYNPQQQKEISLTLLREIGYDFQAGRLDESEHPFTIRISQGDVRITTHFYPYNLSSAIFSSLHEGGHGIYEQNISPQLAATPLYGAASAGIHESQSRFWENFLGRSYPFWSFYYEKLQQSFPEQLKNVSLEDFYKAINKVEISPIRIEADELTYNLHIMLRYELEKALINDEIQVADLPQIWGEKMEEYLGLKPGSNQEGVLQDVHWAAGMFGYFPSYTLGNIYAAQLYNSLKKELSNYNELLSSGQLIPIREWMTAKVHQHGKLLTPREIIKTACTEEINAHYLLEYLEEKFTAIYNL